MSWGKKKEEDPLDKMSNEMLGPIRCDQCGRKFKRGEFTKFVEHLKKDHPESGEVTGW